MSAGRPEARARGRAGFTLIEILVAMLVFLTGVAGIYALLSTGLAMQQDGLEMSRAGRRVEAVVQSLQRQLSLGLLDADVLAGQLPDGTWYRMSNLTGDDGGDTGARLVEIRVAGSERGLDAAPPFAHVLGTGPSMSTAIENWRARRVSAARSRSTLESR